MAPLIAGNWKMNGLLGAAGELEKMIAGGRELADDAVVVVGNVDVAAGIQGYTGREVDLRAGGRSARAKSKSVCS